MGPPAQTVVLLMGTMNPGSTGDPSRPPTAGGGSPIAHWGY